MGGARHHRDWEWHPLPAKVYAEEGIAQVVFLQGETPEVSYDEKQGKYQHQERITLPRL